MITKNLVVEIQNLIVNHESQPVKLNPVLVCVPVCEETVHVSQGTVCSLITWLIMSVITSNIASPPALNHFYDNSTWATCLTFFHFQCCLSYNIFSDFYCRAFNFHPNRIPHLKTTHIGLFKHTIFLYPQVWDSYFYLWHICCQ